MVYRLDRLGRSLRHLADLVELLQHKQVGLRSPSNGVIDTTTAGGKLVFGIFSVLAELERELICERTRAGWRRPGRGLGYTPEVQRVIPAKSLSARPDRYRFSRKGELRFAWPQGRGRPRRFVRAAGTAALPGSFPPDFLAGGRWRGLQS